MADSSSPQSTPPHDPAAASESAKSPAKGPAASAPSDEGSHLDSLCEGMTPADKEIFLAALSLYLESFPDVHTVDSSLIERLISRYGRFMAQQLAGVLASPSFQHLESTWLGLEQMIRRIDFPCEEGVTVELINAAEEDLLDTAGLSHHWQGAAEPTSGAALPPASIVLLSYFFEPSASDIAVLNNVTQVAEATQSVVVGGLSTNSLRYGKSKPATDAPRSPTPELNRLRDEFSKPEWQEFASQPKARYLGLVAPGFHVRPFALPMCEGSVLTEWKEINAQLSFRWEWGNPVYLFGITAIRSFCKHGWLEELSGRQAGGRIEDLPLPPENEEIDPVTVAPLVPTEFRIREVNEKFWSDSGIIAAVTYENQPVAIVFGSPSVYRPMPPGTGTAASPGAAPSLAESLFIARWLHHLGEIARRVWPHLHDTATLEALLQSWLGSYVVTKEDSPGPGVWRTPFRLAHVSVALLEASSPRELRITLTALPQRRFGGMEAPRVESIRVPLS